METKSDRMKKLFSRLGKKFSKQPKDTPLKRLIFYFIFKEGMGSVKNEFITGVSENDVTKVDFAWKKLRPFFCVSEWKNLKRAVDRRSKEVIRLLLSYNFKVSKSLIDYATRCQKYDEAELLLSGVSFSADNSKDAKFLWTATADGKLRFIKRALERGANGQRAMMCALLFKRKEIILYLLSCGTSVRGSNFRYYNKLLSCLIPDGCRDTAYFEGGEGAEDSFQMSDEEKCFHFEQITSAWALHDPASFLLRDLDLVDLLSRARFKSDDSGDAENYRVKSLKDACRVSIRCQISDLWPNRPIQEYINKLPLPQALKFFLRFKEFIVKI